MSKKDKQMSLPQQTYYCIWEEQEKVKCPIRTQYKLKPESLSMYCAICPLRISNTERELQKVRNDPSLKVT